MRKTAYRRGLRPACALKPLVLAMACAGMLPALAQAQAQATLPEGPSVPSGYGTVTVDINGPQMTINQSTQSAIVNWESFSIGSGYTVNVSNGSGVLLNRVVGGSSGLSASAIDGALSATGHVYIVNPAGITFGAGAQVNVGGIVASTLDISNENFNDGTLTFSGSSRSAVNNAGTISTAAGGLAALLGAQVSNSGEITAPGGTVGLVAGQTVVIDPVGDGLTTLRIDAGALGATVANRGEIQADGGLVQLMAGAAATTAAVIEQYGLIQAKSLTTRGGEIVLDASRGNADSIVTVMGPMDASDAGTAGGAVSIKSAGNVEFYTKEAPTPVAIDVSGSSGGSVSIQAQGSAGFGIASGEAVQILATGASGDGGDVVIQATGASRAVDSGAVAFADTALIDATGAAGGSVLVTGASALRAHGTIKAGGAGGGGYIETSAPALDLMGVQVEAGTGGSWVIDSSDVTITSDLGGGSLPPSEYFDPPTSSTLQDASISAALDAGTSVTISTVGTGGTGQGDVVFQGYTDGSSVFHPVDITRSGGATPATLSIRADGSIYEGFGSLGTARIESTAGPLNVELQAGLGAFHGRVEFEGSIVTGGGAVDARTPDGTITLKAIETSGGAVTLDATADPSASCIICLEGSSIDSRVGQGDAGAGGAVVIKGLGRQIDGTPAGIVELGGARIETSMGGMTIDGHVAPLPNPQAESGSVAGVNAGGGGTVLSSTTGAITIRGSTPDRVGVLLTETQVTSTSGAVTIHGAAADGFAGTAIGRNSTVRSDSGDIRITGVGGTYVPNIDATSGWSGAGVLLGGGAEVVGGSGAVRVAGHVSAPAGLDVGAGVFMAPQSGLHTTSGGLIEVTGSASNGGAPGVHLSGASADALPAEIDGSGVVVLRATADPSADALQIDGNVSAGTVLNLRPGAVSATGVASDRVGDPIALGGTAATGFAVSQGEFSRITAPTIVAGSNTHAADIEVVGPLGLGSAITALTLQNDAGGNIQLGAPLELATVGLSSRGDVTQDSWAPITADTVLARSGAGNVLLDNPANNAAANTVGGSAPAGQFTWVDADAVRIGAVTATGMNAATNASTTLSANGISAGTVLVRTLSDNLTLSGPVRGTSSTDLVAAATFQNTGDGSVSGAPWRVWADTWAGEARGGLAGSGAYPNLYGCTYQGSCVVTVPAGANHFIYTQRPTATVTARNVSRMEGEPNPPLTATTTGLILGDTGAGITGSLSTTATASSPPSTYPINGSYPATSVEGYRVNVVPGTLTVTAAPPVVVDPPLQVSFVPEPVLEDANTYTFDSNISAAPICLATVPLDGARSEMAGDELAREWARVRSRPQVTNCVDSERRNSCSDF